MEITDAMYEELKSLCNQLSKFIRENLSDTITIAVTSETFGIEDTLLISYTEETE